MRQATIFDAIAAREEAFNAMREADPKGTFKALFEAFMLTFCAAKRGSEVTGEDIVDAYLARGLEPPRDWRWTGPHIQAAARRGRLIDTGRRAPRRKGHGTAGAIVWRVA